MSVPREPWDFGYAPVTPAAVAPEAARELVVATRAAVPAEQIAEALGAGARAETLLARDPVHWTRVTLARAELPAATAERLREGGISARYVASAERPSVVLGAPLDVRGAPPARPEAWPARAAEAWPARAAEGDTGLHAVSGSAGSWFLREGGGGVAVDRARFGAGAGTRLAVIDDDALEAEQLELDAEVLVGLETPPRHGLHGSLMVAWASGARGFSGVAPGASARLYLIPKPGRSVAELPLAIARAVIDGADVIVCATYVEGSTSPMLDDALELAARLGRRGRGTAVVLAAGREASSSPGSMHASFSLGLGEPASDPRVLCVGPAARGEGWFLWRDRRGRLRPFANRGPALRWLAPGDDIAFPFAAPERLFHAESSGASAIAAGVLLLVLATNPSLRLGELTAVVDATLAPVAPETPARAEPLADASDTLPSGCDRDGHNAKHGHGRLDAGRACLAAADPVCAALVAMGHDAAARAFADARRRDRALSRAYSRRLARWLVRALLGDPEASHGLRALLRHLRLVSVDAQRAAAHGDGVVVRRLQLVLRCAAAGRARPRATILSELGILEARLARIAADAGRAARFERALAGIAARLFAGPARAGGASSGPPGAIA